ncbi:branched-chain amino acid transport system II carrier protein [Bacillus pseudomycoides]|uniref:Branched-chain amino acid transport system carrier protein n=1 Tax=Bacillus pseudomycoides TaxID=64104 RepID=A0AA91ZUY5_9BACI|nr:MULTISPECIES: branched-chain amino acid transport system II carrier protein [Bacillus]PEB52691.1 branched-chain amino acid transport system II carrier protein [Bacillus sp. AFS098217]PED83153.1 branched-chain amino acid transport system II carrier protein [Bacillus pseudomycoides]PEU14006.1 branched-chain amino acid transport system II carrier protein [Bacillus sp. AFS019443]PEU18775.1 branched-chain amino acid transport system II carrier protein [Bacillus sp. AFS014408]PFW63763.1 branched-
MNTVSKKHVFFTGLMLFSLFFGAGNLIFPPMLGQNAGEHFWPAMIGFLLTGVGLPLLTVIAISLSGNGMQQLASHVHPIFGIFFTVVVYIAIGPSMGIPRVANVAYEMGVSSFLPEAVRTSELTLFVYTIIFFAIVYCLSLNPSKLVDWIGNVLTPILLFSIFVLFVKSVFTPLGHSGPAMQEYQTSPIFKGFMEGYLTMDTISALAFGIIVVNAIRSKGVENHKSIAIATAKAGLVAATGLVLVYGALGWLGATSVSLGYAKNGGQLLTVIVQQLFGPYGLALLAVIVTLACLTTCVGLVSACSQYFSTLFTKFSYKSLAGIICALGLLVANLGLTKIIAISVPVLLVVYPIAIVLVLLSLLHKYFGGYRSVYIGALIGAAIVSVFDGLKQGNITVTFLTSYFELIPLYSEGIGWLLPALTGAMIGLIVAKLKGTKPVPLMKNSSELKAS